MENKSLICQTCGEQNNPSFKACWKCHASLDQACQAVVRDDWKGIAKKGWNLTKQANQKTGALLGKALDKVGDFSKHVCVYNGMSDEKAEKISKTVKIATAVGGTAIGCAIAAPAIIAAIGASAGTGAVVVTSGLATVSGGSVAAGGAGMAGGLAVTAGASAIAAGAAGVAVAKREEKRKEPKKFERTCQKNERGL